MGLAERQAGQDVSRTGGWRDPSLLRAAALGAAAAALFAGLFGANRGGLAWFLHLGHNWPAGIDLARRLFGGNVVVPHKIGHDGQYFWIVARDPLLVHGHATRALLDRPAYRAQRIAYPALAAPWRIFGERGLLLGLVATNVLIVAVGTAETVRLARRLGAPDRAAIFFGLTPTVVVALIGDLSDALAVLGVVIGIRMVLEHRAVAAAVAFTVACLAKEVSLLVVAAVLFAAPDTPPRRWRDWRTAGGEFRGRSRWLIAAGPVVAVLLWAGYERWRMGWPPSAVQEFTWPFAAYAKGWRLEWVHGHSTGNAFFATALLIMLAVTAIRWFRRPTIMRAAALAPCLLVPFFTEQVISISLNSLRAVGPAFTILAVDLYAEAMAHRRARAGVAG